MALGEREAGHEEVVARNKDASGHAWHSRFRRSSINSSIGSHRKVPTSRGRSGAGQRSLPSLLLLLLSLGATTTIARAQVEQLRILTPLYARPGGESAKWVRCRLRANAVAAAVCSYVLIPIALGKQHVPDDRRAVCGVIRIFEYSRSFLRNPQAFVRSPQPGRTARSAQTTDIHAVLRR